MKGSLITIQLETKKQFEAVDITQKIAAAVKASGASEGVAVVYSPHTTAGIRINHNEPLLMQDLMKTFYRLVPLDIGYSHDLFELRQNISANERTNGHAHIKAVLVGSSESLIIKNSELLLGEKQSVFFLEFDGGRQRQVHIKILGE